MSGHLLQLAKLTLRLAGDVLSEMSPEGRNLHAELSDLVRDLEAAPAPERRTITREEFDNVASGLASHGIREAKVHARAIVAAWRLTVEDA